VSFRPDSGTHWVHRLVAAGLVAGCSTGAVARPSGEVFGGNHAAASTPGIGPSPLRRMSDSEYLNALSDLFPGLRPTLPQLPADLSVAGFDNAAEAQEPSDVLVARYETVANLYGQAATVDMPSVVAITGCTDWSTSNLANACATQFIAQVGRRLFRRPLTEGESQRFLGHFQAWQTAVDFPGAVQLTLSAMLQSPQFLYFPEPAPSAALAGTTIPVEPYALATRLSFFLWQSVPDDALLDAAGQGILATDDGLRAQVSRMLADPRGKRSLWSFHRQWLGLDQVLLPEGSTRTAAVDPLWTTTSQIDSVTESELFVENVLTQGGTFDSLLTSRAAWVNGEMSRLYGLPAPADPTPWTPVMLPMSQRGGLLTRVAFLAGYSHAGATSPPVRGSAIELRLLCHLPISPPPGVDLSQPAAPPGSGPETNRTLFEQRTSPPACQGCHQSLNGFGFGLESYNAAGIYHTTDDGLPVDATGVITGTDVDGPFDGGIQLSDILANSAVVHACATSQWLRFAMGRAPVDAEQTYLTQMAGDFKDSGGDVRGLLEAIVLSPIFRTMLVED
jgi:uncharacterized protein DUF1592/uncharacterized protein DUF1588/uncharacterized protein DUF1595/uncharacterized protein DUF1585/uncharacterized protein DUF1587